ncbi:DoxX family membrane protein [Deinococcus sp. MIMF12]|uniref:DoxX family membrane protein n=1 Tax=Deinococcus rhizophilus TaxID=3049544 RepID=A0ABT7JHY9_9DEIO|nr:DoxX family membrane protein [Deinococcus rhizophilus]MDL2343568.1 DoxX family membrane protein [Deinococcus rhizophilus]
MTAQAPAPTRIVTEPGISQLLFADTRLAPLWALLRVYVGWQWLQAGWHKVTDPAWVGPQAGTAVTGFLQGALAKTTGERPSVSGWYGSFIENFALPNATLFSYLVAFGEVAVGIALVLGLLTGVAAFFGGLMNANFLFAGTLSTNPLLFILATWLVLAWRVAGWWGLDRWVLPKLGVVSVPRRGVRDAHLPQPPRTV